MPTPKPKLRREYSTHVTSCQKDEVVICHELDSWKEMSRTTVTVLQLIYDLQKVQKFRGHTMSL